MKIISNFVIIVSGLLYGMFCKSYGVPFLSCVFSWLVLLGIGTFIGLALTQK